MPERLRSAKSLDELRALTRNDEPLVRSWLSDYLQEHRRWWTKAYGRKPESTLESLVELEWKRLLEATASAASFVRVAAAREPPGSEPTGSEPTGPEPTGSEPIGSEPTCSVPAGIVFARVQPEPFMGFHVGVLSWIYVDPASRGQGVAGSLIEAAHEWMAGQGVHGRQVYVTIENEAAVELYRRHGYATVDFRMLGS